MVFDGSQFLTWSSTARFSSADGVTWNETPFSPASVRPGPAAINPDTGTIVAARGGWQVWYDQQAFYRSTDGGVTWTVLSSGDFTGSHPIREITFGWADASVACQAP